MYTYKKMVKVLPLSLCDDILTVSACGMESLAMNTFITAQIEAKKLRFHVPDINGKTKCHFIHVGKNKKCPDLQVHGSKMEKVSDDTYLGDVISEDGKNSKNVKIRISKGLGIIAEIMNILEKVTLGQHFFTTAVLLRESLFLNGILTNSEIWYGLSKSEIKEFENLDHILLRKVFNTPFSTPIESLYLELGILNIEAIIMARRTNYLHYLTKQDKSGMLNKFFMAQWRFPATSSEWTEQVNLTMQG